ncbi:MAG: hypothetical protein R3F17_01825 [Planctomycetota bacterium]
MHHPPLRGRCPLRALFTWKLDPTACRRVIPAPLRPKVIRGHAVGVVDCMRIVGLRPRLMPRPLGLTMEIASHLIVAEWMDQGQLRNVLYVMRRDVQVRRLGRAAGLLLPGHPYPAKVRLDDEAHGLRFALASNDGHCQLDLDARVTDHWEHQDLFVGPPYLIRMLGNRSGGFLGFDEQGHGSLVELDAQPEHITPLSVGRAHSSLFTGAAFPAGTSIPDAAVMQRDLICRWTSRGKVLRATDPALALQTQDLREPSPA